MLVEMAVADAYAIAWEFTDQQTALPNLAQYLQHPTYAELLPGQYTDDTQRAVANAHVMLNGRHLDPLSYAWAYLDAYRADPREGYSRGFQELLKSSMDGPDFLQRCQRTKLSNGSVMGAAPLGYLRQIHEVKLAATIQAITTHHPETAIHAQIVALSAHYMIHVKGPRMALTSWLVENVDWSSRAQTDAFVGAVHLYPLRDRKTTIQASSISAYMVMALTNYGKLTDIIKDAIIRGGDTDSAAATSVAIASLCPEIANDLPGHLIDQLDRANPNFGVDFLRDLDRRLEERFLSKEQTP
jgi:ADP-ribosylglycohydrolase